MRCVIFFSLLLLAGCVKDISDATNFNTVKFNNVNGIYALAMVNSKLPLEDLINNRNEKRYLRDNNNGYLSVVFDTISYSFDIAQCVAIPPIIESENIAVPTIPSFSTIADGTEVALLTNQSGQKTATITGIELDQIEFETGSLQLGLLNNTPHSMMYTITFTNLKNSAGQALVVNQIATGAITNVSINLQNYSMNLTGGSGSFNKIDYTISCKITKNGSTQPMNAGFNFNLAGIQYKTITGYFGTSNCFAINTVLPIELFKTNTSGGTLEVENPIIKIYLESDFRMPFKLTLKDDKFIVKYNNGSTDNITGLNFPITLQNAPSGVVPFKDSIISGVISPNLGAIILKNPTELTFGLNSQLNPAGPTSQRNIIRRTDKIRVKTIFEMPMKAKANNFKIDKYIEVNIADIKNSDSIIDKVDVKIIAENTLPLEVIMQIDCMDPTNANNVLLTLLPPNQLVLKGSQNAVPTTTETTVTLTGEQWRSLASKGVRELRLASKFSTTNAGASFEVLRRSQYINLKMGAKIFLKAI